MNLTSAPTFPDPFTSFGELLKYLRRRARLTQLELSIAVGYSEAQISRLEKNQRLPDLIAIKALFIPALHLEEESQLAARFLKLAESARQEDAPAPGIPPYKGLLFFDEADADLFFGREALTEHLVGHVIDLARDSSTRFLTVVGASGSGKSSLVRAGLAVALKRVGWEVLSFAPTSVPVWTLGRNLNFVNMSEKGRVLILVDQFEEIFTLCHDEMERILFIEQLISLAQESSRKITVVIALRADFYSHCAQYPLLRQVVAKEQEYIGQMTTEELRCAIEEPAKRGGWELEPGLVDILLQDVGAQGLHELEPGALPLLSHALLVTWQRRRGRTLTTQGYRASGGVRGAIAETAESVFTDQLNQAQQELARDVFLRLTELGEGTEDTRRRATLNELVRQSSEAALLRAVLNTLAEARLITLNENSAEVSHEALIREWQRLHEWLTQDREGLLLHRHLTEAVYEWEIRGHDPSDLYRGARLAQVREWAADNKDRLNDSERAFLRASIEQEDHDALEREAQRQRELTTARKLAETQTQAAKQLKRRALFLAAAFSLAIVLASAAIFFWNEARQNALKAQSRELAAAAVANLGDDPERSILLALQAIKASHTTEAENALHRSILESRVRLVLHHDGEVWSVTYSPDGKRIGTASQDKTAKIWDADTGKLLLTLKGHTDSVNGIAFSPDGKRVATCSSDHTAKVWDATTGKLLLTFSGHTNWVYRIAFSPDGKHLVTTSEDETAKIWDAATGQVLLTIATSGEVFYDAAYSRDGKRLATSDENVGTSKSTVRVWDAVTGKELLSLPIDGGFPRGVTFSPDGTRVAGTGVDFPNGMMWDAATGKVLLNGLPDPTYGLLDITFSKDGKLAASGGYDQKARIWDTTTGQVLYTLSGHTNPINGVAFNPDGTRLASASWDHTVRVWDITPVKESLFIPNLSPGSKFVSLRPDGLQMMSVVFAINGIIIQDGLSGKKLLTLKGLTGRILGAGYSPDGKWIGAAYDDGQITIWDSKRGRQVATLADHTGLPSSGALSPDGVHIAIGHLSGEINIWDIESGKVIQSLQGAVPNSATNLVSYQIISLTFSPDGNDLVSGDKRGLAIVWDVKTGKKLMTLTQKEGDFDNAPAGITWIAYSPDGRYVALASERNFVSVLNTSTGKVFLQLKGHTAEVRYVSYSPDGKLIATTSVDGTTRVWDATTGANILMLPFAGAEVSFLPNGKRLAINNETGLYVFVLPIDDLVALAKSRLTRTLTTDECQQYLHVVACPAP